MCSWALDSDSLLHMLQKQTKKKKAKCKFEQQREYIKHLIIQISYVVCKLDAYANRPWDGCRPCSPPPPPGGILATMIS